MWFAFSLSCQPCCNDLSWTLNAEIHTNDTEERKKKLISGYWIPRFIKTNFSLQTTIPRQNIEASRPQIWNFCTVVFPMASTHMEISFQNWHLDKYDLPGYLLSRQQNNIPSSIWSYTVCRNGASTCAWNRCTCFDSTASEQLYFNKNKKLTV